MNHLATTEHAGHGTGGPPLERHTAEHPSHNLYFVIYGILMGLLVLTMVVAFQDLGMFNIAVMLTIAVVKAVLVVLYFMHVRYSTKLIWVFAGGGFFWLLIMLTLTLCDYFTRDWLSG